MAWNNEEFAAVFDALYPHLCRFLECMVGRRGTAQEIAQETFLRLYHKGPQGMPEAEARFWLFRVARNLALNELSKSRTQSRLLDGLASLFRAPAPDPEAQYVQSEQRQMVLGLLHALPEDQRAALLLREQHEMTYAEIAAVLKASESKVKVDIH